MFRIARIRIRWIGTTRHDSSEVLVLRPTHATNQTISHRLRMLNPLNLRVRIRWVGFGSTGETLSATNTQVIESGAAVPPAQGFALNSVQARWLVLLALALGTVFISRFGSTNRVDHTLDPVAIQRLELVENELTVNGETVRIAYSSLDIGKVIHLFDHNTETLVRGREANPFVLNFEFPAPRSISGLVMDFGHMDFVLRIHVYGTGEGQPVLYESEYRNQPPEPHVDVSFVNGPEVVSRLYIEIEQLNPPDEPHIHVREVLFQK